MKKKIVLRVLAALAGVTLLALSVGMLGEAFFGLQLTQRIGQLLALRGFAAVLPLLVALAVAALGVGCIGVLIPRKKEKQNYVMQKAENGSIGISVRSIEGLVRTCVQKHDVIARADIRIHETRQGLVIRLDVEQAAGVNIPLAVGLLQKQVRQYVTACTGVDVHEVRVMVENNGVDAPKSPYAVSDGMGDAMLVPAAAAAVLEAAEPLEMPAEQPVFEQSVVEPAAEEEERQPAPEVLAELEALDEVVLPESDVKPEEEDDEERPLHQRLFGAEEQPVIVPAPPELVIEPAETVAEIVETEESAEIEEAIEAEEAAEFDETIEAEAVSEVEESVEPDETDEPAEVEEESIGEEE